MEQLIITINDVRKYRQLGKQLNVDNFEGRAREVKQNELTELLGKSLAYEFFDFLENNWNLQAGTFTRDSDYQFTAASIDLSGWVDYSLRINESVFVIVKTAIFGGTDTIITVEGYKLPDTLTAIEYKPENAYIKLLNGTSYTKDGKIVKYNGIRPFVSWKFLAIFLSDGNVKHSDVGNFSITSVDFQKPSSAEINAARSTYLQNSTREENNIIDYLNENSTIFPLWCTKGSENIEKFNFIVI